MKGTGQCCFCLDRIQSINAIIYEEDKKLYQDIYECGKRCLQDEVVCDDSFDWSNSEGLLSPFCAGCFKSAEKIYRTRQELEKLQDSLLRLIEIFKEEVINGISKNANQSLTEGRTQPVLFVLHTGQSDIVENIEANVTSSPLHTDEVGEFDEISSMKSENEENDGVVKDEDNYLNNELDDVDFPENISGLEVPLESEVEGEREPEYILSNDEPVDGQWPQVILERLQFDENGQLIPPRVHPLNKRAGRRRNAAAKALDNIKKFVSDLGANNDSSRDYVSRHERKVALQQSESSTLNLAHRMKEEKIFKCRICEKTFHSLKCVRQHEARHDKKRPYGCQTCGKYFRERHALKIHSQTHRPSTTHSLFGCSECGKILRSRSGLLAHKAIHDGKIFPCDICQKEFRYKSTLYRHNLLNHRRGEIQKVPCRICGKLYPKYYLTQHEATHDQKNHISSLKCAICKKMFKIEKNLKLHIMAKHDGRVLSCELCGKSFPNEPRLKNHFRQVHVNEECKCDICGKTFKNIICRNLHVFSVHRSKRVQCEHCGLSFKKKSLQAHIDAVHKKILKHQCSTCGKSFAFLPNLKRHEELHKKDSERERFKCEICGDKYFTQKIGLTVHQKQWHTAFTNGPITCDKCHNKFLDSSALFIHSRKAHSDKQHKCEFCKELFFTRCELLCHTTERHPAEDKAYQCKDCPIVFNSLRALQRHSLSQHSTSIYQRRTPGLEMVTCEICGKEIKRFSMRHHKQVHLKLSFLCKFCGKALTSKKGLVRHEKRCGVPKPLSTVTVKAKTRPEKKDLYECDICGKKMSITRKEGHIAMHAGEPKESILCPTCGMPYTKDYFHQKHEKNCRAGITPKKTPTAVKNVLMGLEAEKACTTITLDNAEGSRSVNIYKCNICDRNFRCPAQVKIHARSHTGEKPFSCETCGKSFARKPFLTVHLRTHTGEQLFSCEVCGRSFNQKANLKRHMLSHTEERPHKCPHCEKSFKEKSVLETHVRLHTGEKPYSCKICRKSFSDRSTWYKHQKIHK